MKRYLPLLLATCTLWADPIDRDQLSQTLGHMIVRQLGQSEFELSVDQIVQGMRDEQAGVVAPLNEKEYEHALMALSQQTFERAATQNLKTAIAFLQDKAQEKGMHALEGSRLLYKIVQEGTGAAVAAGGSPLIHYHGTLMDGTVFASSREEAQPITLPLEHTMPGFSQGLVGMKEGEKRVLYIHPELAYGVEGHLPPNSLLIFEVELVKAHAEPTLMTSE